MQMYLVRRYVDEKPYGAYGVCDSFYIVGLFDSEEKAHAAREKAIALAKETDYEEQYSREATEIDIISIEVNKTYENDEQIYLGGSCYIE